ncbi:hypothetical protein [Nitrosospira sp. Nsp1]|uniref:gp53-like domain-containing protein n=1 Tax=Nitrosospira sp. Nsp1 TaxID=136547 RepID=UPI00088AE22F|nr:hypothetical protein [Nitrosospira sp. Nsp1]SCX40502.1 hypothetical protein SAMN05720354_103120 [Nitrosospira sp. Nsp1]
MTALANRAYVAIGTTYGNLDIGLLAMFDVLNEITEKAELDIAGASTCDIGAMASRKLKITGSGWTITSFGTTYTGPILIRVAGSGTIKQNATTLLCPGNADLVLVAGDVLMAWPKTTTSGTSNGWQIVRLARGTNTLTIAEGGTGAGTAAAAFAAIKQAATESATGVMQLATTAEVLAGVVANKVVTPAGLNWPRAFSTNGYQKLPGTPGLIIQWGQSADQGNIGNSSVLLKLTFPIAFPGAVLSVVPFISTSGAVNMQSTVNWKLSETTLSQAAFLYDEYTDLAQSSFYVNYFAIGY